MNNHSNTNLFEVLATRDSLASVGRLTVHLKEFAQVELRGLEDLDTADVSVLKRVDTLGGLLDLFADNLGDELLNELLQVNVGSLTRDNFEDLLTDLTNLSVGGVGGLADLLGVTLGEGNGEDTEEVTIGGLDVNVSLNEGLIDAEKGTVHVRNIWDLNCFKSRRISPDISLTCHFLTRERSLSEVKSKP
jgi:hypothetical protein